MVYFYMIILTYTPNERDIIQMHQILFLEYLMKIPKEGVHLLQKVPIFVLRNNVKATT